MPLLGTEVRMNKIINRKTRRTVIVPMDHGISVGPIPGLVNMKEAKQNVADGGANAVLMHKGLADKCAREKGPNMAFIVHASASSDLSCDKNRKVLICTVEEALRLGADAISFHLNIGNGHDGETMNDCSKLIESARNWGMPVLAMVYPRGEMIKEGTQYDTKYVKTVARLAVEMGADIVKCSYTGSTETFREVVDACCGVPVVIAGGAKIDSDRKLLQMVADAIEAGGSGTSIGRNIFQHSNPTAMVQAIVSIVHENRTVDEAMQFLNN